MIVDKLKELIEGNSIHKLCGATEVAIKKIEDQLNVVLPQSYKWLIREYGSVSFDGFEINGTGMNNSLICVQSTNSWKDFDIPDGYVVIYEPGADWIYCLDTNQMKDGECPIVAWYQGQTIGEQEAENLYQFILSQIKA